MITTIPIKNEKDIAVPDKTVLVLGYEGLSSCGCDDLYRIP